MKLENTELAGENRWVSLVMRRGVSLERGYLKGKYKRRRSNSYQTTLLGYHN